MMTFISLRKKVVNDLHTPSCTAVTLRPCPRDLLIIAVNRTYTCLSAIFLPWTDSASRQGVHFFEEQSIAFQVHASHRDSAARFDSLRTSY